MRPSVYLARLLPREQICPEFSRLPCETALAEVYRLLRKCFADDGEERARLLVIVKDLHQLKGADAAEVIRTLKPASLFFLLFGLRIYGLRLAITPR